jgi:Transcription factor WhiB
MSACGYGTTHAVRGMVGRGSQTTRSSTSSSRARPTRNRNTSAVRLGANAVTNEWMRDAACYGQPIELFFPEMSGRSAYTVPRRICKLCPVIVECRTTALERGDEYGMWGGMTGPELRQERARRTREQ